MSSVPAYVILVSTPAARAGFDSAGSRSFSSEPARIVNGRPRAAASGAADDGPDDVPAVSALLLQPATPASSVAATSASVAPRAQRRSEFIA